MKSLRKVNILILFILIMIVLTSCNKQLNPKNQSDTNETYDNISNDTQEESSSSNVIGNIDSEAQDSYNDSTVIGNEDEEDETSTMTNKDEEAIPQLEEDDFFVTNGNNRIQLDSSFQNLKIDEAEEVLDNNYVGEVSAGDYIYKTYFHKYPDFKLYISNMNYNTRKRDFDDYYITQITLLNANYATAREITIGSTEEDVYRVYGKGEQQDNDGKKQIFYSYNDMTLTFELNNDSKVVNINLSVQIDEQ